LNRTLAFIKELGAKAGVAINPSTPLVALEEVAADVDHVLVMSVNPGFGGQAFLPRSESKVRSLRAMLDRAGNSAPIEVDGGIDLHTVGPIVRAGAEILVAGSSIFHAPDIAAAARALRAAADEAASAGGTRSR
jgi:ribulose-phosphate 3-epimerase